jgi:hypothetical protein
MLRRPTLNPGGRLSFQMHTITTRLATPEEFDVLTALYLRAMRPLLTAA